MSRPGTRSFDADPRALSEIRRFVAAEAGRHTFMGAVPDLQLAVTEACSNAILHSGTTRIRVSVELDHPCIEITIEDDGIYRQKVPMPEADGTGHRGLHLMAALVDDLGIRRGTRDRPGTIVRLVKCKS